MKALTDAELRRVERHEAARVQATHQIAWDSRGTDVDGGIAAGGYLAVDTGFLVTPLDGEEQQSVFVPVSEWADSREQCGALRAAGFEPLGLGYARAH